MADPRFLKELKGMFIKGRFWDKEELIKVAKSQAEKLGLRDKITVVDLGPYKPDLDGQNVVVEGSGYNSLGGRRKSLRK